jgi:hypothetical protein
MNSLSKFTDKLAFGLLLIAVALIIFLPRPPKYIEPPERKRPKPAECRKKPATPEQIKEVEKHLVFEACVSGALYRIPVLLYGGWGVGDNMVLHLAWPANYDYAGRAGLAEENRIEVFFGSPNGGDVYQDVAYKKERINREYLSHPNSAKRYRADLGVDEYYYPYLLKDNDGHAEYVDHSVYTIDDIKEPPPNFAAWPLIMCSSFNTPDTQCTAGFSVTKELQGFYRFQYRHLNSFKQLHLHVIKSINDLQDK